MPVFHPQKSIVPKAIDCQGTAEVTLSFDASAALAANPMDLVLILDRSYSMNVLRMFHVKKGAENLIRMVAAASTGDEAGDLENSRIGIVSFDGTATADIRLTTKQSYLRTALANIKANGETNHKAAFQAAETMLGPRGVNRQIVVMFTDGLTTVGGDATAITDRMKAAGVEIYCIGLLDDPKLLNRWASEPIASHVAAVRDEKKLDSIFRKIASRTVLTGAQDVKIREIVSPDFKITALNAPTFGTAKLENAGCIAWTMDYAGVNRYAETYSLSFEITHTGSSGGSKHFNQSVVYQDEAGTQLQFPSPTVEVTCAAAPIYPDSCPEPTAFTVPGCQDAARVILADVMLQGLGRIVQADATLKAVCPGKRVAVSILLVEFTTDGEELPRGVKHILVPAQTGENRRDLTLKCVQFSLPEAADAAGRTDSICNPRRFGARVVANYVDTDLSSCPPMTQTI